MALILQNLRAETPGVKPSSLVPGQLCFNVSDQILFLGDGSASQKDFQGSSTPCADGAGWYSMPMSFSTFENFFLADPTVFGDNPINGDVLAWDSTLGRLTWVAQGGGGETGGIYQITNAAVVAAPGVTTTQKITAAIGVVPSTGNTVIVSGIAGDEYQGLYFYVGGIWEFAASYAFPTASQVSYNGTGSGLPFDNVQDVVDYLAEEKLDSPVSAATAGQYLSYNGTSNVWVTPTYPTPTATEVSFDGAFAGIPATNVQQAIDIVRTLTGTAQTTADNATADAANSLNVATLAGEAAIEASSAASAAQSSANSALSSANAAQTTADTALTNANNAQTTANLANTAAEQAQIDANAAADVAAQANTTANAALSRSGGTMLGTITWSGGQTFPVSGIQSATTTQVGVVQLANSVSSDSTDLAATAASVKTTYDLANTANTTASNALPKSGGVMTGDITFNAGQPVDAGLF